MKNFLESYFEEYRKLLTSDDAFSKIEKFKNIAQKVKEQNSKLIFAGNGASASISNHGAVDFTKSAEVNGITFNEANLISCLANDYGFDKWISKAIDFYAKENDVIVLTSVSGTSPNIVDAAKFSREKGLYVVSFSGREDDNPLKLNSDLSFWVNSHSYNIVECLHMIWMTSAIDLLIGKSVYETNFR